MNFNDFWTQVRSLTNLSLVTPVRRKPFTVFFDIEHDRVIVNPSTRFIRPIPRSEFQKIWALARNSVNPFDRSQYHHNTRHASYIVPIMKHYVNNEKIQ